MRRPRQVHLICLRLLLIPAVIGQLATTMTLAVVARLVMTVADQAVPVIAARLRVIKK